MIEKVEMLPPYGTFEDIVFERPGPWRISGWNYAKFTTTEGTEWYGSFRAQVNDNFLIAELESKISHLLYPETTVILLILTKKLK